MTLLSLAVKKATNVEILLRESSSFYAKEHTTVTRCKPGIKFIGDLENEGYKLVYFLMFLEASILNYRYFFQSYISSVNTHANCSFPFSLSSFLM